MSDHDNRMERMEKKLDALLTAVEGNNLGTKGIVKRLEELEDWIGQARVRLAVIAAIVSASGVSAWEAFKAWVASGGHER